MEKEKKPFKILALDGGGIKGLYIASLLEKLEQKSGKKVGDCFDLIAGTSTGGLIALGLASGKPSSDLVKLYEEKGNAIFPTANNGFLRWFQSKIQFLKQTLFWGKYNSINLQKALEEEFGKLTLGELNNLVLIPSFNMVNGMPRMFKYPHKEGDFFRDKDIPVVDAALATSSAPTYFPLHEYDNVLYADGGVWANNPSLCAVAEAIQYFVGKDKEYSHIEILSIACISKPSGWIAKKRKRRSFAGWSDKLFQTSMDGQSYFTDYFLDKNLNLIAPNSVYQRVKSPQLSPEQMGVIEMDRTDEKAIKTIISLGAQDGYTLSNTPEIMSFFKTDKTYQV